MGVPPILPQITFAASSQPVGPKSAGKKGLGASELGPTAGRPDCPPPAWDAAICPARLGHLPLEEVERRPRSPSAEAKCSKSAAAAGHSPRLGRVCVWRGASGAEEDCRGGGVMRRGGPLPPPRPRVPAASRQAPPFLLSEEGQVSAVGSRGWVARPRDLAPRAFAESVWRRGRRATQILLPIPGLGDTKVVCLVPSPEHPGSLLPLSSQGLGPVEVSLLAAADEGLASLAPSPVSG